LQTQKSHYVDYTIFYKKISAKWAITLLCIFCLQIATQAQNKSISPYSRFGIGELSHGSFSFNRSLGNSAVGIFSEYSYNDANIASLSFVKQPVFELIGKFQAINFSTSTSTGYNSKGSFEGFALVLPFRKPGGFTLGITPYSGVGYAFTSGEQIDDTTSVAYTYNGTGGLNKAFAGISRAKSWNGDSLMVSFGAKANFLFGNIARQSVAEYTGDYFVNTEQKSTSSLNNFQFVLGGLAKWQPKASTTVYTFGVQYALASNLNGSQELATRTFVPINGGSKNYKDTVIYSKDSDLKVKIPSTFSIGAGVSFNEKLQVNVAYQTQTWSAFTQSGVRDKFVGSLQNEKTISGGVVYQPKRLTVFRAPVWQITQYKFGAFKSTGYINLNNTAVERSGINFGLSIPLRKTTSNSKFHISGEYGVQGSTENNLIKEKYYSIYFGLSLTPNFVDRWFVKRKYD